jgi:hypothetical protein
MFTSFITRVQLHALCSFPKCLRKVKGKDHTDCHHCNGDEHMDCRHWFPRKLFTVACVTKEIDKKTWRFSPRRNQEDLNPSSPVITMGWMANTDISPPCTMNAVLNYIAKYVSKEEKKSVSYEQISH